MDKQKRVGCCGCSRFVAAVAVPCQSRVMAYSGLISDEWESFVFDVQCFHLIRETLLY